MLDDAMARVIIGRKIYQNVLKDQVRTASGKTPSKLAGLRLKTMRTSKIRALVENEGLRKELGILSRFEKGTVYPSLVSLKRLKRETTSLNIVAAGRTGVRMEKENKELQLRVKDIDYRLKKTTDAKERKELIRQHNEAAAKLSRNSIAIDELESIRKRYGKLLHRK